MSQLSGKPIMVLKEGTNRIQGKKALKINIEAIIAVAESIKTTLGPKGLNKMIVDSMGDVTVTGDGAKILEEYAVENPAAKMVVELSKTIHKNVGDGASSAVIFVGELMAKVTEMIDMNLSPTIIYEGFLHAIKESKKFLDTYSVSIDISNKDILKNIVTTALNSKSLGITKEIFSKIIVDSIFAIIDKRGEKSYIDLDNIQIVKKEGSGIENSTLIQGIIVDKEVVNPMMPKRISNAKIALIDSALEIIKTEISAEIQISDPNEINEFLKHEENILKEMVNSIVKSGANVVFCQKGIDEMTQHFLAKNNILAVRRIKQSDMKKIARATGGTIINQVKTISSKDLGSAGIISEHKIAKDNMIFIEDCEIPKSVTILIRGGTEIIVDDIERAVKNGLAVLKCTIENPKIIGGAGAVEIELRKHLFEYSQNIGGKEQIAINNYANSLEIIPKILIENSGRDTLDVVTALRAKGNYKKNKFIGFNSFDGELVDTFEKGIIEPMILKKQILTLSTELVVIFIRIDDYIRSSGKN